MLKTAICICKSTSVNKSFRNRTPERQLKGESYSNDDEQTKTKSLYEWRFTCISYKFRGNFIPVIALVR